MTLQRSILAAAVLGLLAPLASSVAHACNGCRGARTQQAHVQSKYRGWSAGGQYGGGRRTTISLPNALIPQSYLTRPINKGEFDKLRPEQQQQLRTAARLSAGNARYMRDRGNPVPPYDQLVVQHYGWLAR
jgi:hypothetical protein